MDLVCDTNVWYSFASGALDADSVKSAGHTLVASSVNWMELSTDLTDHNFERKKAAAAAVLAHADVYLPDTERYLADIWGIELPPLNLTCQEVLAAVSNASSVADLESGSVGMAIKTDEAAQWRRGVYDSFAADVIAAIQQHHPSYADRSGSGRVKYVGGDSKVSFLKTITANDAVPGTIMGTRERLLLMAENPVPVPSENHLVRATKELQAYGRIYPRYLFDCATRKLPDKNDWGDLECFVYVGPSRMLFTLDQRWKRLAVEAGLANAIFDPSP
jgi:hypothetical protein